MKVLFLMALLLFLPGIVWSKTKCDQACWLERWYQLETMRVLQGQKQARLEKEVRQQKDKQQHLKEEQQHKLKILQQVKESCSNKNLDDASFEERSLCHAVQGYFDYGIEVPNELLVSAKG